MVDDSAAVWRALAFESTSMIPPRVLTFSTRARKRIWRLRFISLILRARQRRPDFTALLAMLPVRVRTLLTTRMRARFVKAERSESCSWQIYRTHHLWLSLFKKGHRLRLYISSINSPVSIAIRHW